MADIVKLSSGVPRVPLRPDDLVERIAALVAEADVRGLGSLAYLLDMALTEARHQIQQRDGDAAIDRHDPHDLWRPVPDRP